MRPAQRPVARFYPQAVSVLLVGGLGLVTALGIESWPLSSYPMYSVPEEISRVEVWRFAFELEGGEVVPWKPDFPYIARDLDSLLQRLRGRPGFERTLEIAARAVLADLAHQRGPEDRPRIRRVRILRRWIRPGASAGRFAVEEAVEASFAAEALR
jgi:hypothetical protein